MHRLSWIKHCLCHSRPRFIHPLLHLHWCCRSSWGGVWGFGRDTFLWDQAFCRGEPYHVQLTEQVICMGTWSMVVFLCWLTLNHYQPISVCIPLPCFSNVFCISYKYNFDNRKDRYFHLLSGIFPLLKPGFVLATCFYVYFLIRKAKMSEYFKKGKKIINQSLLKALENFEKNVSQLSTAWCVSSEHFMKGWLVCCFVNISPFCRWINHGLKGQVTCPKLQRE